MLAQQTQWNYSGSTTPCLPANATWEGRVGIGFNNPQSLLHVHSMYCPSNGLVTSAIERLQTFSPGDAFGISSFQFWSNSVGSGQDWMVGAIEPITMSSSSVFNATNTGNWFGGLAFFSSGSNQRPQANDKIEVMRLYDRKVGINTTEPKGALDIVTSPLTFKNRIIFDAGGDCIFDEGVAKNNFGPRIKFYRPTGSMHPNEEHPNAMSAWINLEFDVPPQLGFSRFNIFTSAQSIKVADETETDMKRRLSITGSGNIGIGQIMPDAKLHITNGALLVEGAIGGVPQKWTFAQTPDPTDGACVGPWTRSELGAGTRLMWIPEKAAFRAGAVNGPDWNTANIGQYSIAMGYKVKATNENDIAIGYENKSEAQSYDYVPHGAITIGHGNNSYGTFDAIAMGFSNTIHKGVRYGLALGKLNSLYNYYQYNDLEDPTDTDGLFAFGDANQVSGENQSMTLGYQITHTSSYAISIGRLFANNIDHSIKMGLDDVPGFMVRYYPSGSSGVHRVGVLTDAPQNTLDVNGNASIGFNTGSYGAPSNGLVVNGKVGVGTASPQEALSVVGTGDNNQVIIWSNDQTVEDGKDIDLVVEKKVLIGRNSNYGTSTELLQVDGGAMKSSGGSTWAVPSDIRYKKDISPFTDGLKQLRQIDPVWFRYNGNMGLTDKGQEVGIIAQDIQKIIPYCISESEISQTSIIKPERRYQVDAVDTIKIQVSDKTQMDEHGHYKYKDTLITKPSKKWVIEPAEYATEKAPILTYNSNAIQYILINSVKVLDSTVQAIEEIYNTRISELNNVIDSLQLIISNQESRIARLESQSNINRDEINDVILEQNNPNPYSTTTTITYYVPDKVQGNPQLIVARSTGSNVLLSFEAIKGTPTQQVIDASNLDTGVYVYSLIIQGQVLASKRMIVIK